MEVSKVAVSMQCGGQIGVSCGGLFTRLYDDREIEYSVSEGGVLCAHCEAVRVTEQGCILLQEVSV